MRNSFNCSDQLIQASEEKDECSRDEFLSRSLRVHLCQWCHVAGPEFWTKFPTPYHVHHQNISAFFVQNEWVRILVSDRIRMIELVKDDEVATIGRMKFKHASFQHWHEFSKRIRHDFRENQLTASLEWHFNPHSYLEILRLKVRLLSGWKN